MSDCENNGCFCLDELTECGENLKRLIAALNEQYPVCLEKRDYGSISELHITAKALWAEFANILHPLGEYGDENLYSTALKMFEAIQRFGYLNGGNYPALVSALNSFADMLPNKKSIDAKAAAHLMNRIKMGYFPTDLSRRLIFPKAMSIYLTPAAERDWRLKPLRKTRTPTPTE